MTTQGRPPDGTGDEAEPLGLEIAVVAAGRSWWRSLLTTLGATNGAAVYQFVASPDHPGGDLVAGPSFTLPRQLPDDLDVTGPASPDMTEALAAFHRQLLTAGWTLAGRGEHWWSRRYRRYSPNRAL